MDPVAGRVSNGRSLVQRAKNDGLFRLLVDLEDLLYDLADYYLYDLERVDGGFTLKATRGVVEEDADSVFFNGPTAATLHDVGLQ